jgi:hypothetical protein
MKENKENSPQWTEQKLPNIYNKLEAILYQASWVIQKELERQKEKAENIKNSLEQTRK